MKVDLNQARDLVSQVASTFGVPEAQFQLAQMMLAGDGGSTSLQQAGEVLEPGPQERSSRRHVRVRQYPVPGRPVGQRSGAEMAWRSTVKSRRIALMESQEQAFRGQ